MTDVTTPALSADLLRLDDRTHTGLVWLQQWARSRITGLKRRRKRLPPDSAYTPEEMAVLQALLDLEAAAKTITSLDGDSLGEQLTT